MSGGDCAEYIINAQRITCKAASMNTISHLTDEIIRTQPLICYSVE